MAGIIGGGLATSVGEDAQGLDIIPSGTGETVGALFGEAFAGWASVHTARAIDRGGLGDAAWMGEGNLYAPQGPPEPGPAQDTILEPAEAIDRFGIPGVLTFDKAISLGLARDLYEAKRAEVVRQDTINRRPTNVLTGQVAQLAYGFVGGMLDPLNIAAALIPGVGEARVASVLGVPMVESAAGRAAAETLAGRLGTRAISGATAGAAGTAALEPAQFLLSRAEREDWSMAHALRNIAFGAALGGGLHASIGAVGDWRAGRRGVEMPPDPTLTAIAARLEAAGPEARETLLRGAVAQHVEGEPVRVAPALDAADTGRYAGAAARDPRLSEWMQARDQIAERIQERTAEVEGFRAAREARNRGEAPAELADYATPAAIDAGLRGREAGLAGLRGRLAAAEHALDALRDGREPGFGLRYDDPELNRPAGVDAPGIMPQGIVSRLREMGGLRDSGGELAARDLHRTPGLVRPGGQPLDRAAQALADEGYLPLVARDRAAGGPEQVNTVQALLDALDEHHAGRPRIREQDAPAWDELMSRHEDAVTRLRDAADYLGIPEAEARGLSRGQVADMLQRRAVRDEAARALDEIEGLPGWDEPLSIRSPAELAQDMAGHLDEIRAPVRDAVVAADERAIAATTERAPQLAAPDKALAEAQQHAEAAIARVQTEAAAGRLPPDSLARINEAAALAEGDARAFEAAGACLAARGL